MGKRKRVFKTMKSRPAKKPALSWKSPLPFKYVFILSLFFFLLLTIQALWFVDHGIRPTLMAIARTETQKIATEAINEAIASNIIQDIDMENMLNIETDEEGQVTSVRFNARTYNQILADITSRVQIYLKQVEDGKPGALSGRMEKDSRVENFKEKGIVHVIPLGQATNNALLAQLGPQIPVRFTPIGEVKASMSESIFESGINNTYLRVSVDIEVDVQVVIPFAADNAAVATSVPVGMVFISGDVPQFYSENDGESPAPAFREEEITKNE
ncbi:sporulation protein YunB [Alteribacillus sp. HJP-4]|uniref:sporulation protein YunB n=1 Tax=Alteribacillus sp. HJP-4 TaxID=2775394 RepID=UPI0035CD2717